MLELHMHFIEAILMLLLGTGVRDAGGQENSGLEVVPSTQSLE